MSKIETVKKSELQNTVGKQITTLAEIEESYMASYFKAVLNYLPNSHPWILTNQIFENLSLL